MPQAVLEILATRLSGRVIRESVYWSLSMTLLGGLKRYWSSGHEGLLEDMGRADLGYQTYGSSTVLVLKLS
jgi:hypothetical protein